MIHRDITFEDYCELPGFNASLLKIVHRESLFHAKACLDGRRKESAALDFGHSFHEMLLRNKRDFVIRPDTYPAPAAHADVKAGKIAKGDPLPWRSNAGACVEWLKENNPEGLQVHSGEEVSRMLGMCEAVKNHPDLAPHMVETTQCEIALTGELRGMPFKCLTDMLPADSNAPIIDLKKCACAKPEVFTKQGLNLGYPIQAALNVDLIALNTNYGNRPFWFVAVEDEAPHAIWIQKLHDLSPSILRMGRKWYRAAAVKLAVAMKNNDWPGYTDGDAEAFLPTYMIPELENT